MKIELKKIQVFEKMSDETNCFYADLYIDNKKVGYAKNDGQGGDTFYQGSSKSDNQIIEKAQKYCLSLPKIKIDGFDMELEHSLDLVIDDIVCDFIKNKELKKYQKKMEKLFETAIVYGIPNGENYFYLNFKRPLNSISPDVLKKYVDDVRINKCKNGEDILNTNLMF